MDYQTAPTDTEQLEPYDRSARTILSRSIKINGRATSISLEAEFWEALRDIARESAMGLGELAGQITSTRLHGGASSALRVFILEHFRAIWAAEHAATQSDPDLAQGDDGAASQDGEDSNPPGHARDPHSATDDIALLYK